VYNVIGTSINGCTTVAFALIEVDPCSAVNDVQEVIIDLVPSPVIDFLSIRAEVPVDAVNVVSPYGKVLTRCRAPVDKIDLGAFAPGVYIVEIEAPGNTVFRKKIVKAP
jgi:hypothetical protein